jgi:hypothetical protein
MALDELIQLRLNRAGIARLGILQQQNQKKGDNGYHRIKQTAPRFGIIEKFSGRAPKYYEKDSENESAGASDLMRSGLGKTRKKFFKFHAGIALNVKFCNCKTETVVVPMRPWNLRLFNVEMVKSRCFACSKIDILFFGILI